MESLKISETAYFISTKFHLNDPWVNLYQIIRNCYPLQHGFFWQANPCNSSQWSNTGPHGPLV